MFQSPHSTFTRQDQDGQTGGAGRGSVSHSHISMVTPVTSLSSAFVPPVFKSCLVLTSCDCLLNCNYLLLQLASYQWLQSRDIIAGENTCRIISRSSDLTLSDVLFSKYH